jgi:pimeloyl-ACP methyl ester carboxylesterase
MNLPTFKWLHASMAVVCICTPFIEARAETPPPTAEPVQLAVDEGKFVRINGLDQWITIRGRDLSNPVLLFVHGGPGMGSSITAPVYAEWEKYFTLVQWDQPGGGFTQMKTPDNQGAMTIARFKKDGLAVTEHVLARLNKKQLVLMGNSWGTLIGLEMIKERPDLFSAYVGSSQAIGHAGNKLGYELALKAARDRNDATAIAALERVGPPPYEKFEDFFTRQQYSNAPGLPPSAVEQANSAEFWGKLATPPSADATWIAVRENLPDQMTVWNNFVEVQKKVFRETWSWEARSLGLKYDMPIFVYQGAMDINTPVATAREWLNDVEAPMKGFEVIADASHNTMVFERELLRLINRDVRPLVVGSTRMANK